MGSIPGLGRSPGEENGYQPQYSCLENSMDRGAWQLTVYGITASDMTEQLILSFFFLFSPYLPLQIFTALCCMNMDIIMPSQFVYYKHNLPEKAMATHSSTLAWKMPWTEEPGRLQSMGSLRVGHDWATSLSLFTFMHWRRKWQPTPAFVPGEPQGRGSLVGCCPWGRIESDTTELT